MNDHQEFFYTFNKLKGMFIEEIVGGAINHERYSVLSESQRNELSQKYIEDEESEESLISIVDEYDFYIGSFCKTSDDLLSQWRGYASGEVGYCIEFDEEKLKNHAVNKGLSGIVDCEYDDAKVKIEIDKLSEQYANKEMDLSTWLGRLMALCVYSKHSGFKEENEKRIVMTGVNGTNEAVSFRCKGGVLVPYIPFKFDKEAIKSITIGPAKHQGICKKSLDMYLKKLEYKDVKIELSDTPLTT
jgi:hypothetical protein